MKGTARPPRRAWWAEPARSVRPGVKVCPVVPPCLTSETLGNVLLSSCFSSLFLPLQIQVGKFNYTIAMLHLGGGETAIIVSIVICSILLVLSVVGKGTEQ